MAATGSPARANRDQAMQPVGGPAVWSAAEMAARDDWLYRLSAEDLGELEAAAADFEASGRDLLEMRRELFPLPSFGARLHRFRAEILDGRGFVQLRGLPVARYDRRQAATVFLGIGAHLGDEMASQNAKGHVLGHVRDIGQSRRDPDQRGPYSRERIPFHVDCCDIVGLLCLQPAKAGGESSIASSGHIYNTLLARRPELIAPLTRPVYRDRRGEIPPGKEPWYAIPVFSRDGDLLSTSIEPTYIGSVARHFDKEPNDDAQREGVAAVQALAEELHLDIAFEQGDMQFLHNHTIMHSRQGFEDFPEPDRHRHLLRLWLLNHDGRPLPAAYYERHGAPDSVRRPGGIVGPDTVLHCPLEPA